MIDKIFATAETAIARCQGREPGLLSHSANDIATNAANATGPAWYRLRIEALLAAGQLDEARELQDELAAIEADA